MQTCLRLSLCILVVGLLPACTTTDQQVELGLERLAANEIGSSGWEAAVDELVAIGRPAARQLIAHLNPDHYKGKYYREYRSEQGQIRTGAAQALGHIRPRGATAALDDRIVVAYTDDERIACIWAIGQIGFSQLGYDALKVQLKDTDGRIRLEAAIAVVKMDLLDGVPVIEAALQGTDEELAAVALRGIEESSFYGVPLLTRLAAAGGSREPQLRARLGKVTAQLVDQLGDEDPLVRRRAARALGLIGDASARNDLLALLDDANNLVRFNAAAALATMDDADGIGFLFSALQTQDPILRANAVLFLTRVQRSSGAVESRLLESLVLPSPLARAGAAQVLGEAQVAAAVESLLSASQDTSAHVRCSAVMALGQIGSELGIERIRELLNDEDDTVSYYAEWALARLGRS
jgi:HEAT repeat protein